MRVRGLGLDHLLRGHGSLAGTRVSLGGRILEEIDALARGLDGGFARHG